MAACAVALAACAGLGERSYDWGDYDGALYKSTEPRLAGQELSRLEDHVRAVEQSRGRVAPGLYAELGTMHLQAGNQEQALAYYRKERDTWPESARLMDRLIAQPPAAPAAPTREGKL